MNEIQELKNRIDQIDREIGNLQNERLLKGVRFSFLLKQEAQASPQVESTKQFSKWFDDDYGIVGCQEKRS